MISKISINSSSKSSVSSATPVGEIIDKINKTSITSVIVGISEISVLSKVSNSVTHAAILLLDINLEEQEDLDKKLVGILMEFGDYSPEMSTSEKDYTERKLVHYRYGDQGGLRYYGKNLEEFKKEFGNRSYIEMDISSHRQKTFDAFINEIAPTYSSKWTKNSYSLNSCNCQHFVAEALKLLRPTYSKFKVTNTVDPNNSSKKTKQIPNVILKVLNTLKN